MPEILNFSEACEFLKLSKPALYGYVRKGRVPAAKLGRKWVFHKESLNQWLQDRIREDTSNRSKQEASKSL